MHKLYCAIVPLRLRAISATQKEVSEESGLIFKNTEYKKKKKKNKNTRKQDFKNKNTRTQEYKKQENRFLKHTQKKAEYSKASFFYTQEVGGEALQHSSKH